MSPNVILFGITELTAKCLEYLLEANITIDAVVPFGREDDRGRNSIDKHLDEVAVKNAIPVLGLSELDNPRATHGVSVGYPHILNKCDLALFEQGIVNLHLAPLPWYRGALTSLSAAILADQTEFGVTLHRMDEGIDTGPIYALRDFELPRNASAEDLVQLLLDEAFKLFASHILQILSGDISATPQQEVVGYSQKKSKLYQRNFLDGMSQLDATADLAELDRKVRALTRPGTEPPYFLTPYGNKIQLRLV